MNRRSTRAMRTIVRLFRPIVDEAMEEARTRATELLADEDLLDAWIRSRAKALDDRVDFSEVPVVGNTLEAADREVFAALLAAGVDNLRDELEARS